MSAEPGRYQLVLHQSEYSPEEFNKVCNILSEYGSAEHFPLTGEAHLKEHGELISSRCPSATHSFDKHAAYKSAKRQPESQSFLCGKSVLIHQGNH